MNTVQLTFCPLATQAVPVNDLSAVVPLGASNAEPPFVVPSDVDHVQIGRGGDTPTLVTIQPDFDASAMTYLVNQLHVSRVHVMLRWVPKFQAWAIQDTGSSNGTRLDGKHLGNRGWTKLPIGTHQIRIGCVMVTVEISE